MSNSFEKLFIKSGKVGMREDSPLEIVETSVRHKTRSKAMLLWRLTWKIKIKDEEL